MSICLSWRRLADTAVLRCLNLNHCSLCETWVFSLPPISQAVIPWMHPELANKHLGPLSACLWSTLQPLRSASNGSLRIQMTEHSETSWTLFSRRRAVFAAWGFVAVNWYFHCTHRVFIFIVFVILYLGRSLWIGLEVKWEGRHNSGCVKCNQDDTVQFQRQGPSGILVGSGQRHMFYYFTSCFTWHDLPYIHYLPHRFLTYIKTL